MSPIRKLALFLIVLSPVPSIAADFIPLGYFGGPPPQVLPSEEEAKAAALTPAQVDLAIKDLRTPVPEFSNWIAQGTFKDNPNSDGSRKLRNLADRGVTFSKEQIDSILPALNHVSQNVRYDVELTLRKIWGLGFLESGESWTYRKQEQERKPYVEAWLKFWKENGERFASNQPYILNDLSLDAEYESPDILKLTLTNHGSTPIRLWLETDGKPDSQTLPIEIDQVKKILSDRGQPFPFSVILDQNPIYPVWPREVTLGIISKAYTTEQKRLTPDRSVQVKEMVIAPGAPYRHRLHLKEAFPTLEAADKKIVVRYDYALVKNPGNDLWRGELRSAPVTIP